VFSDKLGELFVELSAKGAGGLQAAIQSISAQITNLNQIANISQSSLARLFEVQTTRELAQVRAKAKFGEAFEGYLDNNQFGQAYLRRLPQLEARAAEAAARINLRMARAHGGFFGSDKGQRHLERSAAVGAETSVMEKRLEVLRAQAAERHANSPAGQAGLQQESQLNAELSRIRSADQWRRMVMEQGRFNAGLSVARERLGRVYTALAAVSQLAPVTFGGMVGLLERSAAAASPVAYQTLTNLFRVSGCRSSAGSSCRT
jgi:hypothetical protein